MARKVKGSAGRSKKRAPMKEPAPETEPPKRDERKIFDRHMLDIKPLWADVLAAKEALAEANKDYRQGMKAAKADGVDTEVLAYCLKLAEAMAPDEITKHFTSINWTLVALNVPVGTQLGLFPDGRTIATAAEDEQTGPAPKKPVVELISTPESIEAAKAKGRRLGHNSGDRYAHGYPEGSPEALAAEAAWTDAQRELAVGIGKPGNAVEAVRLP